MSIPPRVHAWLTIALAVATAGSLIALVVEKETPAAHLSSPPATVAPLNLKPAQPGEAVQPGVPSPSAKPSPSVSATKSAAASATPAPGATKTATAPAPNNGSCTLGAKLVPTCDVLWGAAAGGFTDTPRDEALRTWEATSGRPTSIYHTYHSGNELFPTSAEIAMAHQADDPRILMLNWKVAAGTTWAKVAAGDQDTRIDREAAYLKKTFTDPFFLVLHHEPEDDVKPAAGSGMTAADFAAMFRHTILRLRADGVHNAISVVVYMNYEKWENESWWPQLYPGDDVVDWIGVDTYLNADPGGFHNGDFASMMNRTQNKARFPGFYNWATKNHPSKPLVLAEWGVYGSTANKPAIFNTVLPDLARYPRIKAMVYFDTPKDQGGRNIEIDTTSASTEAFRKIAASPIFAVHLPAL